jgi:hypothetical protein
MGEGGRGHGRKREREQDVSKARLHRVFLHDAPDGWRRCWLMRLQFRGRLPRPAGPLSRIPTLAV